VIAGQTQRGSRDRIITLSHLSLLLRLLILTNLSEGSLSGANIESLVLCRRLNLQGHLATLSTSSGNLERPPVLRTRQPKAY
jgi:hypothetical protein